MTRMLTVPLMMGRTCMVVLINVHNLGSSTCLDMYVSFHFESTAPCTYFSQPQKNKNKDVFIVHISAESGKQFFFFAFGCFGQPQLMQ